MARVHALLHMPPQPRQARRGKLQRRGPKNPGGAKRSFDEIAGELQQEALPTTLLQASGGPQTLWPNKGLLLSEWTALEVSSSDGARTLLREGGLAGVCPH